MTGARVDAPAVASTSGSSGVRTAKKCLEDFFAHIEGAVRKKCKSRTNNISSVDWTKMQMQLNNAPTNKPRTPILSSSRTWRTDLSIDIRPEVKQQLREMFIRYCGWGDKRSFMFMSRSQFIRFARDMDMCDDVIDVFGVSILFEKILAGSLDPGAAARVGMLDFILALTALATKLHSQTSVQTAFGMMVETYLLPRANAPLADPEPHDKVVLQSDVLDALEKLRPKLLIIWEHYMTEVQMKQEARSGGGGSGDTATLADNAARSGMTLSTFLKFCSEFEVTANVLSKLQLQSMFKKGKFGISESGEPMSAEPNVRLSFPEFLDCITRCALLAYKYRPPQVPITTMDFSSSYQSAAKQLWLRECKAGGRGPMEEESSYELQMPAAVGSAGLGNEDQPHYDEVLSRAPSIRLSGTNGRGLISRAVSIAQGGTRSSGPGGMDVMLVHAEPSKLQEDPNKPLHLQQFTCDWVGRPGLALSETGRLRLRPTDPWVTAGFYHTGAVTDPKFDERMRLMMDARNAREQHLAALQLQYQAERRQELREAAQRATAKRQELELVSGQTIARLAPSITQQLAESQAFASRSGSAPPRGLRTQNSSGGGGVYGSGGSSVRVAGLEEVLSRTGGRFALPLDGSMYGSASAGGAHGPFTKPLVRELQEALIVDFGSKHNSNSVTLVARPWP